VEEQEGHPAGEAGVYHQDTLEFLLSVQPQYRIYYFDFQGDVKEGMRSILLEWLVDIHSKMKLQPETLFLTVSLVDRFLSVREVARTELQLLGVTALFMASKFEETYRVPPLQDLAYICANTYSVAQILAQESVVLQALDYELHQASPLTFLNLLVQGLGLDARNYHLCWYILELAMMDYNLYRHCHSVLAAGALFLVNKIRKKAPHFNRRLLELSGADEGQVRFMAKELSIMLLGVETSKYSEKVRAKFSTPEHDEVASIRIERGTRRRD
jgi:hypothetical protein